MRFYFLTTCLLFSYAITFAQSRRNFTRLFQYSLAPGIGSNGLHGGGYANYFSFNLTSGYSRANYLFEIGAISNLNVEETRGLQFAGIANVTGGNAFAGLLPKEIEKKEKGGFEANLSGWQLSGVANIVLDNVYGLQTTGGVNVSKGALQGVQIAGISNTVYKYSFAVQLAGLYNVSVESMDGVQIAGLFNLTSGGLFGLQLGLFNSAGYTEGKNSIDNNNPTGVQIGIVNKAEKANGFQIGLLNISGIMQGTQIGLVNFFKNARQPQTKNGTSIGLINIGTEVHLAWFANELFNSNIELGTGVLKNNRMSNAKVWKSLMNSIIYSNDARFISNRQRWAFGYGLKKFYFNRSSAPGYSKIFFVNYGLDIMHINHERNKLTKETSLLCRPGIAAGHRINPKNKICYVFAAVNYNIYQSKSAVDVRKNSGETSSTFQHWPGYTIGVMIK